MILLLYGICNGGNIFKKNIYYLELDVDVVSGVCPGFEPEPTHLAVGREVSDVHLTRERDDHRNQERHVTVIRYHRSELPDTLKRPPNTAGVWERTDILHVVYYHHGFNVRIIDISSIIYGILIYLE